MKYVIVAYGKTGYAESKYLDMFDLVPLHGAKRFNTQEEAQKVCTCLNDNGYKDFHVVDMKTAAREAIKYCCRRGENAEVNDLHKYLFRNLFQDIESLMEMLFEEDND